jgi:hypothetical protein
MRLHNGTFSSMPNSTTVFDRNSKRKSYEYREYCPLAKSRHYAFAPNILSNVVFPGVIKKKILRK